MGIEKMFNESTSNYIELLNQLAKEGLSFDFADVQKVVDLAFNQTKEEPDKKQTTSKSSNEKTEEELVDIISTTARSIENSLKQLSQCANESFTSDSQDLSKSVVNNPINSKSQPLKACKLYISHKDIANRIGIHNPDSFFVTDVNKASDNSVELTVVIDSTVKPEDNDIELAVVKTGTGLTLRRQPLNTPSASCQTAKQAVASNLFSSTKEKSNKCCNETCDKNAKNFIGCEKNLLSLLEKKHQETSNKKQILLDVLEERHIPEYPNEGMSASGMQWLLLKYQRLEGKLSNTIDYIKDIERTELKLKGHPDYEELFEGKS